MIYVEAISESSYQDEVALWREAGFEFYPYHFLVSFRGLHMEPVFEKGRPLNSNCGLIRDSFLSTRSIGYLILVPDGYKFDNEMAERIAGHMKNVIVDLGIDEFQVASNYKDKSRSVDMSMVYYAIQDAHDGFARLNHA